MPAGGAAFWHAGIGLSLCPQSYGKRVGGDTWLRVRPIIAQKGRESRHEKET